MNLAVTLALLISSYCNQDTICQATVEKCVYDQVNIGTSEIKYALKTFKACGEKYPMFDPIEIKLILE